MRGVPTLWLRHPPGDQRSRRDGDGVSRKALPWIKL